MRGSDTIAARTSASVLGTLTSNSCGGENRQSTVAGAAAVAEIGEVVEIGRSAKLRRSSIAGNTAHSPSQ